MIPPGRNARLAPVPGHGNDTAHCASYAANLNSLAASDARVFHLSPLSRVNLGSRKGVAVLTAVEAGGAKLHDLPPYSPNFNPNEHAFSQPNSHLREVAHIT